MIAAVPIYGKRLNHLLLQNQESFEAESWYVASRTQGLLSFLNDGRKLTFDFFTAFCRKDFGNLFKWFCPQSTRWHSMPIYGKTLKNLVLQNNESYVNESWYTASGT